jgi:nickel/cobalt transporter (NicO) family protein
MQRRLSLIGVVVAAGLGLLWLTGQFAALQSALIEGQRQVQSALAGGVRALKGGQPGALWGLIAVSFSYGVLHAAGPGHGKLVIGGYGIARRVVFSRLAALALIASLAQAAVAVLLVYALVAALGLGRDAAQAVSDRFMAPLGLAMVAGVGLWLFWRGFRAVWRAEPAAAPQSKGGFLSATGPVYYGCTAGSVDAAGASCPSCGHAHGPSLSQVQALTGWRDGLALVAGIAMRPCTGALFLLILTWQLQIGWAGIAGAFAMGIGTALVTIAVAALAVWSREGALASLPAGRAARALPWVEILAGGVVMLAAVSLLFQPS